MKRLFILLLASRAALSFGQLPAASWDVAADREQVEPLAPARFAEAPSAPVAVDTRPDLELELAQLQSKLAAAGFDGRELSTLWSVSAAIRLNYVDEVDKKKLLYGALKGMAAALDPHTAFLEPGEYEKFKRGVDGTFAGIGLEMGEKQVGQPVAVRLAFPDSPADRQGLRAGDRIVEVDGRPTVGMTLHDAVSAIGGAPGTLVRLKVLRWDGKKAETFEKTVERAHVTLPVVHARLLKRGVGYIQLAPFGPNSAEAFLQAAARLQDEGMKALVVDLRNNPGGLLQAVQRISSFFLKQGDRVVSVRSRDGQEAPYDAELTGPFPDLPLAILVDGGSASASEIFAGVMQDHDRGIVVGSKTFGKGTVQDIVEFPDGSALKLTFARYYLPSGRSIDRTAGSSGVTPDVVVPLSEEKQVELAYRLFRQLRGETIHGSDPVLDAALLTLTATARPGPAAPGAIP